jgi:hypothetical protein
MLIPFFVMCVCRRLIGSGAFLSLAGLGWPLSSDVCFDAIQDPSNGSFEGFIVRTVRIHRDEASNIWIVACCCDLRKEALSRSSLLDFILPISRGRDES